MLETFNMAGQLTSGNGGGSYLNGELLDNDIRFSDSIRESIDEIKYVQKLGASKSNELEKARFLGKYM